MLKGNTSAVFFTALVMGDLGDDGSAEDTFETGRQISVCRTALRAQDRGGVLGAGARASLLPIGKFVTPQRDGNSRVHYTKKRSHFYDQLCISTDRVSDFSSFRGAPFESASQGSIAML